MAKRRLADIAAEHDMSFEQVRDLAFNILDECALTGKGKNTWVNEVGQVALDDIIAMPVLYRGKVLSQAPNPLYIMVYLKDITRKVPVKIPRKYTNRLTGKMVYVQADTSGENVTYKWVKTPNRD